MSFIEDYKRAVAALKVLNESKTTFTRRQEIARMSLREQLEQHKRDLEKEFGKPVPDHSDIDFALGHDKGWDRE